MLSNGALRPLALLLFALLPSLAIGQAPRVEFVWSGALQPTSIHIVAGLSRAADSVRVALTTDASFDDPTFTPYRPLNGSSRTVSFFVDSLESDTRYRYAVEVAGALDTLKAGSFRTPPDGPFSFTVIAGGCSTTGSDRPVFDVIRRQEPQFFLHVGDFHYENLDSEDPDVYRQAYRDVLASRSQSALYRSTPIAYMWDDHDYGPNNSDRFAPGQEAAREAYRTMIPHYPLAAGLGNVPIFQAFTMGRLRFVMTDLRSSRRPHHRLFDRVPTMMGERQKDWFKQELLRAKEEGQVVVWVSTVPWIYRPNPRSDSWGGYAEEREDIANFLKEHEIDDIFIMGGDAHMVAMDDGTNSDYATGGDGVPIPVIQSAPLDQAGSEKGGPYSEGAYPGLTVFPPHNGQWTLMEVEDEGTDEVCVRWTGYRTRWDRPSSRPLVEMSRCFDVPTPEEVSARRSGAGDPASPDATQIGEGGQ
jgi:alkaline phosphatase D